MRESVENSEPEYGDFIGHDNGHDAVYDYCRTQQVNDISTSR